MNIYKSKYRLIKEKLNAFGTRFYKVKSDTKRTGKFLKEKLNELVYGTWDYLIAEYLTFECTEEERLFLDLVFFRKKNVTRVSFIMHLSETACYERITIALNDLLILAVQKGLIAVYMREEKSEAACCVNEIEEYKIEKVYNLLSKNRKCKIENLQNVLDAIVFVETTRIPWRELPREYGLWKTVYNIYNKWRKEGILNQIKDILLQ